MNRRLHHMRIPAGIVSAAFLSGICLAAPSPSPLPTEAPKVLQTGSATLPSPTVPLVATPTAPSPKQTLKILDIPDMRGKISIPEDWTFLPGKLLEGDVLLAVREKITSENDPWTTGLSMTIDRNGAKDSGMKAGDYALGIAKEAREKAGEEASPISESTNGPFREIRFDFPVQTDTPIQVTEVLRANDRTGTVTVILWQSPKSEVSNLHDLREAVLKGLTLDPNQ